MQEITIYTLVAPFLSKVVFASNSFMAENIAFAIQNFPALFIVPANHVNCFLSVNSFTQITL